MVVVVASAISLPLLLSLSAVVLFVIRWDAASEAAFGAVVLSVFDVANMLEAVL